jgi:ribosomal protein S18 acetylase RimI-like enzyme
MRPLTRRELTVQKFLRFRFGVAKDAAELAALHTEVADHLTSLCGKAPWSSDTSEKGALFAMRNSKVFVATEGAAIMATLPLATKKPWAIDTTYFTQCDRPLYLLGRAVAPARQRQGIGRRCLEEARRVASAWPADAIRLDAFDAEAGASGFYHRCGYAERGRVTNRKTPLIYYELLLTKEKLSCTPRLLSPEVTGHFPMNSARTLQTPHCSDRREPERCFLDCCT